MAETIRKRVENNIFTYEWQEIKITSCFGICTLPSDAVDWKANDMILLADKKLYEAKHTGRNKTVK
ncbi:MAG TPA: hypothetical protein DIC60_04945 [Lachnospiraceae bacterium]|nr:hypothetical protein [Lachnospiraceae bacterium]